MIAMANPQKEHGHVDVANELAEQFARLNLNGTQFRLLWVVIRKTYGWNKPMDTIALAQFCEATGLPKKLVSRELLRLVRRRILLAWGDDHHPKQFGIQKDYERWLPDDPDEVSTNRGTPIPKVSTKTSRSVYQSVDEVSTNQGTTNTKKTTRQKAGVGEGAEVSTNRGTPAPRPLPKDFPLTGEMRAWFARQVRGLPDIDYQHGRFCHYWRGAGREKADWGEVWKGWMLEEAHKERQRGKTNQARHNSAANEGLVV